MVTIVKTRQADDCVAVELDNGESLKIPYKVAGLYRLEAGRAIDATEYAQLRSESLMYRCRKTALDYLAICPRSGAEMERFLARKKFDHDMIREIVGSLREAGYIDDADYASRYISSRLGRKPVGRNLLSAELQKRGVSRSVIRKALEESGSIRDSFDEVYRVALKKYDTIKHKKNSIAKLAAFLYGRGFESDLVAGVIERIRAEEGADPACE